MKKLSGELLPLFIILLGLSLRIIVIITNDSPYVNNYDTLRKVTLNFSSQREVLSAATDKWVSADSLRTKLYSEKTSYPKFKALNREMDASNHPPLYYYLYHPIKIWFDRNSQKMTSGYVLNLVIWIVAAFLFFKLCCLVFKNRNLALAALVIYASHLGLFTSIVLLKSYVLLELLITLSLYVYFKKSNNSFSESKKVALYGLIIYCAFLTHYFAYIVVAVFSTVILIDCLLSKEFRKLIQLGCTTILATIVATITYPNVIRDVIEDKRSVQIQENLESYSLVTEFEKAFQTLTDYVINWPEVIILILAMVIWVGWSRKKTNLTISAPLLILLFSILSYAALELLSARTFVRYISVCIPFIILGVVYLSGIVLSNGKWKVIILLLISFLFSGYDVYRGIENIKRSNSIVQHWGRKNPYTRIINEESSILIVPDYIEHFTEYAVFEASRGKQVALSNELNLELIKEKAEPVIIIHRWKAKQIRKQINKKLLTKGFKKIQTHNGFEMYVPKKMKSFNR